MRRLREVAVVIAHEHGHATHDGRIDLVGSLAPLLHGVVQEHVFVHVVGDFGKLLVVALAKLHDRHLLVLAKCCNELAIQVLALLLAERELERLVVERHRHQRAVYVRQDLVLVIGYVRKPHEELMDPIIERMIDVWAIEVHQNTRIVDIVIGVARNVTATLEHRNAIVAPLGKPASAHSPGKARADHDRIVVTRVEISRKTARHTHGCSISRPTPYSD